MLAGALFTASVGYKEEFKVKKEFFKEFEIVDGPSAQQLVLSWACCWPAETGAPNRTIALLVRPVIGQDSAPRNNDLVCATRLTDNQDGA